MFNTILSYGESAVLSVVGKTGEAYRTELPSKTQRAPRDIEQALDGLVEKHLLISSQGEVRLTQEGRNLFETLNGRQSSRPNRVLLTDESTARAIQSNTKSLRLNEAIDEELNKLSA